MNGLSYICTKTYVVEALLNSTHNICFHGELERNKLYGFSRLSGAIERVRNKKKVLDISKRKEYGNDFLFSLRGIRKFMKKSYRIKTMSAKAFHFFGAGTNG